MEISFEEWNRLITRDVILDSVIETFLTEEEKEIVEDVLEKQIKAGIKEV